MLRIDCVLVGDTEKTDGVMSLYDGKDMPKQDEERGLMYIEKYVCSRLKMSQLGFYSKIICTDISMYEYNTVRRVNVVSSSIYLYRSTMKGF